MTANDDTLPGLGSQKGVPRVASHLDWSRLVLDDVAGFVLSRIDGRTSLGEICLLSPFPREQTTEILRSLHVRGIIDIPGMARPAPPIQLQPPAPPPPPTPQAPQRHNSVDRVQLDRISIERPATTDEPMLQETFRRSVIGDLPPGTTHAPAPRPLPSREALVQSSAPAPRPAGDPEAYRFAPGAPTRARAESPVLADPVLGDPSRVEAAAYRSPSLPAQFPVPSMLAVDEQAVDLSAAVRIRVDEMLALVGQVEPAMLLGVDPGAARAEVRRAYYKLSKEFHPDRHFNRKLGPYKRRLQVLFNAITEAFEHLMIEAQ